MSKPLKLTKDRRSVLEALIKGHRVTGRLAFEVYPAVAYIRTRKTSARVKPSVVEALYRADLIDKNWEGLGNWTATITPAGRAALEQAREDGA